jgi:hypothetical protein
MVTSDLPETSRCKDREEIRDIVRIQENIPAKTVHKLHSFYQYSSKNNSNVQHIVGRATYIQKRNE